MQISLPLAYVRSGFLAHLASLPSSGCRAEDTEARQIDQLAAMVVSQSASLVCRQRRLARRMRSRCSPPPRSARAPFTRLRRATRRSRWCEHGAKARWRRMAPQRQASRGNALWVLGCEIGASSRCRAAAGRCHDRCEPRDLGPRAPTERPPPPPPVGLAMPPQNDPHRQDRFYGIVGACLEAHGRQSEQRNADG